MPTVTIDTTEPNQDCVYHVFDETYTLALHGTVVLAHHEPPIATVFVLVTKPAIPPTTPTKFDSGVTYAVTNGAWLALVDNYPGAADGKGLVEVFDKDPLVGGVSYTSHEFMPNQDGEITYNNLGRKKTGKKKR